MCSVLVWYLIIVGVSIRLVEGNYCKIKKKSREFYFHEKLRVNKTLAKRTISLSFTDVLSCQPRVTVT